MAREGGKEMGDLGEKKENRLVGHIEWSEKFWVPIENDCSVLYTPPPPLPPPP